MSLKVWEGWEAWLGWAGAGTPGCKTRKREWFEMGFLRFWSVIWGVCFYFIPVRFLVNYPELPLDRAAYKSNK